MFAGTSVRRMRFFVTMRVTATVLVVVLLTQAATAGLMLSIPGGRAVHAGGAMLVMLAGVAQLVTAILVWLPGGGTPRFALTSGLLLVLLLAQLVAGQAGATVLHVPLGAALLAGSAVLAWETWSRR